MPSDFVHIEGQYISFAAGLDQLRIHKQALQDLLWASVPEAVTDPASEAAKVNRKILLAMDAMLYSFGPAMLKSVFPGQDVRMPKGADRVQWYLKLMIFLIAEMSASRAWTFDVEEASGNDENGITYTIRGVSPSQTAEPQTAAADAGAPETGSVDADQTIGLALVTGG